ncbi:glycoside hydrolase family 97 protein [Occallatibacter riparius]|uniref:Glycoside hydrolase family 97 protein n=2 Tax=Occallatibacter riparius TaxID=1002689 RepID=A0A9J7BM90_9BACT|nr:glycoside hydrolase family 97 protein [Occallatibacter riparius]
MMLLTRPGAKSGLHYIVEFHGKRVFDESLLGLKFDGQPPLGPGMKQVAVKPSQADETYTIPAGKTSQVRDHYNAIRADFEDDANRKLTVEIRAYDDGIAFRMIVPDQPGLKQVRLEKELTDFRFSKDAMTYPLLLDGYQSSYEDEYQARNVSGIHNDWLIGLPLLTEIPGVAWVGITEADIENYAGMYLRKGDERLALRTQLSPRIDHPSIAVEGDAPLTTPWRVLMIADNPGRLIESNIVLNLNPPSKIADTSWIKAGKTSWDWWSGDYAANVTFTPGMNTATLKHYIDFSAASGFPYMLIDAGWALANRKSPDDYAAVADITKFDPAVDMPELLRYAKEKNVKLWLWSHWTSVDKYMDKAFPLFEQWGIAGVKIDFMQRDDQQMVAWYRHVVDLAAQYHLMIDFHGAFKPDGLRRTYPNLITREGVMGKEYLKWSARTSPVHNTTLPFTRMLAGPLDYTPGAFGNANRETFVGRNVQPMSLGTRAHELALYVVLESPLQMVSDYPERYAGQHDFEFIKQVPATWDEVRVLGGRPMENITVARRSGKDWYIGSITNWDARTVRVPLDFLGEGKYTAEIYADAPDADQNATHTTFSTQPVDKTSILDVKMVSGGGNAIWVHPSS